jgi:DNA-binding NarL/FixJ family response regulator
MRVAIEAIEPCQSVARNPAARKARVIVADGSSQYLAVICSLLDLHELVDVIGRAASFDEAIQLAVKLQPDLVLMDIEMPFANLAVATIILSGVISRMKIVGMCATDSVSLRAPSVILAFSALIHKGRLRQELCSVLDALNCYPGASNGIPAQSGSAEDTRQKERETYFPCTTSLNRSTCNCFEGGK